MYLYKSRFQAVKRVRRKSLATQLYQKRVMIYGILDTIHYATREICIQKMNNKLFDKN